MKPNYKFLIKVPGYCFEAKYRRNLEKGKKDFEEKAIEATQFAKKDVTLHIYEDTGERSNRNVIWKEIEEIPYTFKPMPRCEIGEVLVLNEYGQEDEDYEGMVTAEVQNWTLNHLNHIEYSFLVTFKDGQKRVVEQRNCDLWAWTKKETISV